AKLPDDRYRTIDVKVRGKDLTVLARRGYRASKGPDLAVVTAPEVAPLLVLDRAAEANDVPMRVGTLRAPTAGLTVVARMKDAKSQVVQYAAQTYDLTGQAGLTHAGAGDVLFYRDVTL